MAKKQNDKDFISSQDFLGDLFKNVGKSTGTSLFEKLSTNARQEAIQPLVKSLQVQALTKPLTDLISKAKTAQKAGMAAYIAANPEIDKSLLFDGTGDIISGIMQENNLRFREINRQLSFMDVTNPRYQELANELNKINKTSAQLREDNTKLLNIRNAMTETDRAEDLTDGTPQTKQDMYEDILSGNTENFVNINGKLHWQDPNDTSLEPVAISSIDAGGPLYVNSVVKNEHINLYSEVIKAQYVDDAELAAKINNIWSMEGVGNEGLKSFIFDSVYNNDFTSFNTTSWFESWFEDNNIVGAEAQEAEKERIRNRGVKADGATGNVRQHFSAWYHRELKKNLGTKYNALEALNPSKNILNVDEVEEEDDGEEKKTDLLENITTEDGLIKSIFSGSEEDAITKINQGIEKFTDFLPEGVSFEEAQLGFDIIKVDTDPFGVVDSLETKFMGRNSIYSLRFDLENPADEARFRKFVKIMKMMKTKKYPQGFKPSADMGQTYKDLYDIL